MKPEHKTRLAAIQLVSGPDVQSNLEQAGALIGAAAQQGAELVLLPEYFALISADEEEKVRRREPAGQGPIQAFLARTAREHSVWIIGGSIALEAGDAHRMRNSCLVFNPQGEQVARYDKIHLFNFQRGDETYDEARTIEPGADIVCFDASFGRVGLSICYDLRFPELYRRMGPVDLIVVPAAFTATTGRAHWEVLLRARAIENQCYVLACGQGGEHPSGRKTWGHSMLIDPWGEILSSLASGPGVVCGDFDPARIAAVRESLPALRHRLFT
ncbi:carbon-nitrogen hydrolase family protein [Uliginosibacterium paludis]|uniref:Carbon-nitrogen hydrolase family protein n=1 Tax=Uliginosibacterium paludis TaxID=1615952 RepID=A0ABV2CRS9_9RHOO